METSPPGPDERLSPIRIGCAGWSFPREHLPREILGASHLHRYSQVFDCCEINSSFHRPHKTETWKRWANTVPTDFRFAVKVPRTITHELRLNCDAATLSAFLLQVRCLGDRLGPLLFQLPPSLEFERVIVEGFLQMLRRSYVGAAVCEPRHPSWYGEDAEFLLREFCVARAAADPACVPAAQIPGGSDHLAYFRLHGSPRTYYSSYNDEFLSTLAASLLNRATAGDVWCIFDNTASGHAVRNALDLIGKLRQLHM